jgi:hypothetical protein
MQRKKKGKHILRIDLAIQKQIPEKKYKIVYNESINKSSKSPRKIK